MTSHATLTYSGRIELETNDDGTIPQAQVDTLHTLLDDAIAAYEGDTISLETAVVHFEREGQDLDSMPRVHVDMQASGDLSELATIEDNLAEKVVSIGMEADKQTAKDAISL